VRLEVNAPIVAVRICAVVPHQKAFGTRYNVPYGAANPLISCIILYSRQQGNEKGALVCLLLYVHSYKGVAPSLAISLV